MKQTMDAVYEDGVFKPMKPPKLSEGQHVRIKIETPFEKSFDDLLELAAKVYEGFSADDIDGIEKIAHGRRDFFGDRTGA